MWQMERNFSKQTETGIRTENVARPDDGTNIHILSQVGPFYGLSRMGVK